MITYECFCNGIAFIIILLINALLSEVKPFTVFSDKSSESGSMTIDIPIRYKQPYLI
jgi:hypothetical protein